MKTSKKKTRCGLFRVLVPGSWALISCSVSAIASDLGPGDFDDLPVVLSASRLRQPLIESPSAVTVIDQKMIEASGARHVADLLRLVPGVVVGYNDGNHPVVSMHGMAGTYASGVQVLLDGVSVYSPLWGGVQWEELPIAMTDIERIEVIRGPNAALFGSNSFAAVINIITRHPEADTGWLMTANAGNRGTQDFTISRSAGLESGVKYRATFGQRYSEGFTSRPDTQRQYFGNLRAEYQLDATDSVHLSVRGMDNKKDNGDYTVTDGSSRVPHPNYSNSLDLQVRWSRAFSADDEIWVQAYHLQSRTRDKVEIDYKQSNLWARLFAPLGALIPGAIPFQVDSGFETYRDGIELQRTMRWSPDLRLVWGAEARRDAAVSLTYLGSNQEQSNFMLRAYGNLEWRVAKDWTLNAANMLERNMVSATEWSPKFAVTWQPIVGHVLRTSISSAQRIPSLYEERNKTGYPVPAVVQAALANPAAAGLRAALNALGITDFTRITAILSSGQVDNEHTRVQELGYAFNNTESNFGGEIRLASEQQSGLVSRVGAFPSDFINLDRVRIESGDVTLHWRPVESRFLRVAMGKAFIRSSTAGATYDRSAPAHTVSFLWDETLGSNWRASANYQRVGPMYWTDAGNGGRNPMLAPIDFLNFRLGKQLKLPGFAASDLAIVVQNALGHHREYFAGIASNGTADTIAPRVMFLQFSGQL